MLNDSKCHDTFRDFIVAKIFVWIIKVCLFDFYVVFVLSHGNWFNVYVTNNLEGSNSF